MKGKSDAFHKEMKTNREKENEKQVDSMKINSYQHGSCIDRESKGCRGKNHN